jgi:hypothetical protein
VKARIKTELERIAELDRSEILRINKVWMIALHSHLNFQKNGVSNMYAEVCKIAGELYETPERWYYIDEKLREWELDEFLPPEDLEEREKTIAEIHREHGRKWRQYHT